MNAPVFYTQDQIDDTEKEIISALQRSVYQLSFADVRWQYFTIFLHDPILPVTDTSGNVVGRFNAATARLEDDTGAELRPTLPGIFGVNPFYSQQAQVISGVAITSVLPQGYQTMTQDVADKDKESMTAYLAAAKQQFCNHQWVDVGFFSGKQACKICNKDRD